jgi:hypothetical protein
MALKPFSFRTVRRLWSITVALVPVFICVAEFGRKPFDGHFGWSQWSVVVFAIWSESAGFSARNKFMLRAAYEAENGMIASASRTWSAAQLIGFMSAESVVLWGVIANVNMGFPRWISVLFYAVGIVLIAAYRPVPFAATTP